MQNLEQIVLTWESIVKHVLSVPSHWPASKLCSVLFLACVVQVAVAWRFVSMLRFPCYINVPQGNWQQCMNPFLCREIRVLCFAIILCIFLINICLVLPVSTCFSRAIFLVWGSTSTGFTGSVQHSQTLLLFQNNSGQTEAKLKERNWLIPTSNLLFLTRRMCLLCSLTDDEKSFWALLVNSWNSLLLKVFALSAVLFACEIQVLGGPQGC